MKTVSILGVDYKIIHRTIEEDPKLADIDGYCDWTTNLIVIKKYRPEPMDVADVAKAIRAVIRHEIVHAFAFESGLAESSEWAMHEEMVDWIARQFPKMAKAFADAGVAE